MAQATAPILDSTNSEVTNEASDFRLGGQSGLSASVARTAALDPQRTWAAEIAVMHNTLASNVIASARVVLAGGKVP